MILAFSRIAKRVALNFPSMQESQPLLSVHALECRRGRRRLFHGLTFEVRRGQAVWVTGRNGSGKTTLLRTLCGLTRPEAGRIDWRGEAIGAARDEFHASLAYLGHAAALKDDLTAAENLVTGLAIAGLPPVADARAALGQLGLAACAHLPARQLSQGQRRRVALARLWLSGARPLWILDEPFVALDAESTLHLARRLESHLEAGGAVIFTTHQEIPLAPTRLSRLALGA